MAQDIICYHKHIKKEDIGGGILMQILGTGSRMNVLHWNMKDGAIVKLHSHENEQFGYVIKGGFDMIIGKERYKIYAGDAYFVPSGELHEFTAIGETEAIDVFNPVKTDLPKPKK